MPKVSIIIAVYNVEKYLKKCLDSLVNQTLTDIEIICTDDGSTDNSLSILKEYQASDNRIKIIEQENQGPGIARNNALDIATGKYIMIVDPDDWLELDACELAYNQIEKNQNDLVIFDYRIYKEETGELIEEQNHFFPYKDCINNPRISITELKTSFIQNALSWQKIYRRDFLEKNKIRFLPLYLGEDSSVAILSIMQSQSISILKKYLYNYRVRNNSSSLKADSWKENIQSRIYISDYLISNNFHNKIIANYVDFLVNNLIHWYKIYTDINPSIKTTYKKEICANLDKLQVYMNLLKVFRYYIYKYNLEGIYYKLIRPIGKYCIVLPYRKIKALIKGK